MLYDKKKKPLTPNDFAYPTAEYRGAPFWAWNDELEERECVRQAEIFREMGFGGYHMHPRDGLATPYLGDKFNSCVRACVEYAKEKGMLAWLYDEDRYPSGFAGGAVTKDGRYRRRGLIFTCRKRKEDATYSDGRQTGGAKLLATYAVKLCFGKCLGYTRLQGNAKGCGRKYYAYLVVDDPTDTFNQCGYVDALCKDALTAFADYTYGTYQREVGSAFGKSVPAIFTDEPQIKFLDPFKFPLCPCKATIPWTDDFAESYRAAFGADVFDTLPELFFDVDSPTLYRTRFTYHTHRVERFAEAFADNLGQRADALGLHLTGHLMEEPTLYTQCRAVGETMRHYKHFGLPGIDMLCGRHEYTTAKQTESVVRQEGKEGMLCELYGVSRWVVEFGKFKEEGDWLACLGVTVRVPHLSFYSMRGEAKRDYPPSIFYQAPWWEKYRPIEDHFARLNVALTRGKAVNEVAVIHPIESYFLFAEANRSSAKVRKAMDRRFLDLTDWLLFGGCDFDFISEALLPSQRREDPLAVGECRYKTILVPCLDSMRSSTLDYLKSFRAAGGKVVFLGKAPAFLDGEASDEAIAFAKECVLLPFDKESALSAVKENLTLTLSSEKRQGEYLATMREEGEGRWVFLTAPRAGFPYPRSVIVTNDPNVIEDEVCVGLPGSWSVTEYDTMTGEIRPLAATERDGGTFVRKTMYNNDSLLLRFDPMAEAKEVPAETAPAQTAKEITLSAAEGVAYELGEPNVLFLDKGACSLGGSFRFKGDLDIVTKRIRKALKLPPYRGRLQPWVRGEEGEKRPVTLRFEVESEVALAAHFACEYRDFTLTVNGEKVTAATDGYYVDKAFRTTPIEIKKGRNVLDVEIPFGLYDRLENCYLLGAFGVALSGVKTRLVPLPEKLLFGDVVKQLLPFYSGKITYRTTFLSEGEDASISLRYASALVTVRVNGEAQDVFFAPYAATLPTKKGENALEIEAYIPRENTFGAVHIRRKYKRSDSPSWYNKTGLLFRSRRYILDPGGVLEAPIIRFRKWK